MDHERQSFPALEQRIHGLRQTNFADAKYLEGGSFEFDKSAAPIQQLVQARANRDREIEEIEFLIAYYERGHTPVIRMDARAAAIAISLTIAFFMLILFIALVLAGVFRAV